MHRHRTSRSLARAHPVRRALACLLVTGALAAAPADAGTWLAAALDRNGSPVTSLSDAASRVQRRYGGQVIAVAPAERDGRRGMRVKVLLDDGRVKTLFVDERTGEVVDRRGPD